MGDLFDAAAMYDEDYLYFFAAPGDSIEFAAHGPAVPGAGSSGAAAAVPTWAQVEQVGRSRARIERTSFNCGELRQMSRNFCRRTLPLGRGNCTQGKTSP